MILSDNLRNIGRSDLLHLPPLYPITDARLDVPLSEQVRRLGQAGFPLVQFRGKPLDAKAQWMELHTALSDAALNGGWPLICVNDRVDLALLANRENLAPWGVHLGQTDLPPTEVRRLPGMEGLHLGTSTHGPDEWRALDPACDHAGIGPFRATATKGDHADPIKLEGLRLGCGMLREEGIAPIAIGGLTMQDARDCFEAGAESLAMVGEIARAEDPQELLWQAQILRWSVRPPFRRGQGIALVGGSGCGKSTLALELASRLGMPGKDLDAIVEAQAGKPIARIFAEDGEATFRGLESASAQEIFMTPGVLALGGGAWESSAIREAARRSGYAVLWIAENPGRIWERVGMDPARPLAQEKDAYFSCWRKRLPRWMEATPVLPLGRSVQALAEALAQAAG